MSVVLFPAYNNFGVRLFLDLRGPEGFRINSSTSEPTPTETPLPGYWGGPYRAGTATERYSLEKLANMTEFWLKTCQDKQKEVRYFEASSLRDAVKALKAASSSQEYKDLINRAEQELVFARPQAAINNAEFWLDMYPTSKEIYHGEFAAFLDALAEFRQTGEEELLTFLQNTSPITEHHKERVRFILAKAQKVLKQLEKFLEKERETLIQLSPNLQPRIDELPDLVKEVKKIVEDMEKFLGDTSEDTDLPQKSQPQNT